MRTVEEVKAKAACRRGALHRLSLPRNPPHCSHDGPGIPYNSALHLSLSTSPLSPVIPPKSASVVKMPGPTSGNETQTALNRTRRDSPALNALRLLAIEGPQQGLKDRNIHVWASENVRCAPSTVKPDRGVGYVGDWTVALAPKSLLIAMSMSQSGLSETSVPRSPSRGAQNSKEPRKERLFSVIKRPSRQRRPSLHRWTALHAPRLRRSES